MEAEWSSPAWTKKEGFGVEKTPFGPWACAPLALRALSEKNWGDCNESRQPGAPPGPPGRFQGRRGS